MPDSRGVTEIENELDRKIKYVVIKRIQLVIC